MFDVDLMALALQNKERAQLRKKEMKGCGYCSVDPPDDAQIYSLEDGLREAAAKRLNMTVLLTIYI